MSITLYGVDEEDLAVGDEGVVRIGLLTVNGDKLRLSLVEGELGSLGLLDVLVLLLFTICVKIKKVIFSFIEFQ